MNSGPNHLSGAAVSHFAIQTEMTADVPSKRAQSARDRTLRPCAPCQRDKQKCRKGANGHCERCLKRDEPCAPGKESKRNVKGNFQIVVEAIEDYDRARRQNRPRRKVPPARRMIAPAIPAQHLEPIAWPSNSQDQSLYQHEQHAAIVQTGQENYVVGVVETFTNPYHTGPPNNIIGHAHASFSPPSGGVQVVTQEYRYASPHLSQADLVQMANVQWRDEDISDEDVWKLIRCYEENPDKFSFNDEIR